MGLISENQEKAYLLNSYFASVFQKEESEPLPNFGERQCMQELNTISLTSNKISKAIDRVKPSKSQGPDNIHPMIIKECKIALLLEGGGGDGGPGNLIVACVCVYVFQVKS